jgi:hypothetical protein
MQGQTQRRYYLFVATEFAAEANNDLASDLLSKRAASAITAFPAGMPSKEKLKKVISEELFDILEREIFLYQGLEDLIVVTEDELAEAGLNDNEIDKLLTFLEPYFQ